MAKWITLRARFPDDEFNEIERIKEQYGLSYNEIIRSGVKFYVGLTLAKELLASSIEGKGFTINGKDLGMILNSSKYQANLDQRITKVVKLLIWQLFEKGMDFRERTRPLRKDRKVGRPKTKRKVGRPQQGLD
ncbi:MAG TPA: hypothetical protein VD731_04675 [Nitrosopumilaceae archaeon]|nr:hypothetical protein [Nitrosopumilaceae archaeon]